MASNIKGIKVTPSPDLLKSLTDSGTEIEKLQKIVAVYREQGFDVSDIQKMLDAISSARDLTMKAFT